MGKPPYENEEARLIYQAVEPPGNSVLKDVAEGSWDSKPPKSDSPWQVQRAGEGRSEASLSGAHKTSEMAA
ncbi:MAG: hypothetical protein NZM65_01095 [Flavobacteriales bacterium]|nr:hypothetical protein [Flavobacteriales bacterium]MDW8409266.1 hypothetical protein [Flavobacteriales bacterium]